MVYWWQEIAKDLHSPHETTRTAFRPGWGSISCRLKLSLPNFFHITLLLCSVRWLLVAAYFRFKKHWGLPAKARKKKYWSPPLCNHSSKPKPKAWLNWTHHPSRHKEDIHQGHFCVLATSWWTELRLAVWTAHRHRKTSLFTNNFTKWGSNPHNLLILTYLLCCTNSHMKSYVTGFSLMAFLAQYLFADRYRCMS